MSQLECAHKGALHAESKRPGLPVLSIWNCDTRGLCTIDDHGLQSRSGTPLAVCASCPQYTPRTAESPLPEEFTDLGGDCPYRSESLRHEDCELCGQVGKTTTVHWCALHACECAPRRYQQIKQGRTLTRSCFDCIVGGENRDGVSRQQSVPVEIKLAAIACYYNPAGYKSLRSNYERFVHDMQISGVPLFCAEVAFDDQPFVTDAFLKLRGGPNNYLWQKERLLNLLAEKIPSAYTALAWFDADMLMFDSRWPRQAINALKRYPVAQLWNRWHFTGPTGETVQSNNSVGHLGERFTRGKGHPGGAWAARREIFPLLECHAVGGGDTLMAEGWLGIKDSFLQQQMSAPWLRHYRKWASRAWSQVAGRVTTLPGDAVHLYHGTRPNRRYDDRTGWLKQHNYDPAQHVRIGSQGLLEWTEAAPPGLKQLLRDYFFAIRKEDEGLE